MVGGGKATALLARRIAVRHTVDIDVYRDTTRAAAESDLRAALHVDAGDWFRFEAGASRPVADGVNGVRIPIAARLGTTLWSSFHIDLVAEGVRMTGAPDHVPALTALSFPGLDQPGYRDYPVVDHIADKVWAILERPASGQRPSTRFKDLVDLVAFAANVRIDAQAQRHALACEAQRRQIALPSRFDVPDRSLWETGHAAEARRAVLPTEGTLDDALAAVRPFLDPLFASLATGVWDPESRVWRT